MQGRARAIAERIERESRRRVTVGIGGIAEHAVGLPECARRATLALQLAAHAGERWLVYSDTIEGGGGQRGVNTPPACLLRMLRAFSAHKWSELEALQADYVRAALLDGGGRISRIRLHLEYALGGLLDELESSQVTDPKTLGDLRERLRDSLDRAASSTALVNAFRDATTLIVRTRSSPKRGPLELRLTRAARFMVEHCAEPISRALYRSSRGAVSELFLRAVQGHLGIGLRGSICGASESNARSSSCSAPRCR